MIGDVLFLPRSVLQCRIILGAKAYLVFFRTWFSVVGMVVVC